MLWQRRELTRIDMIILPSHDVKMTSTKFQGDVKVTSLSFLQISNHFLKTWGHRVRPIAAAISRWLPMHKELLDIMSRSFFMQQEAYPVI